MLSNSILCAIILTVATVVIVSGHDDYGRNHRRGSAWRNNYGLKNSWRYCTYNSDCPGRNNRCYNYRCTGSRNRSGRNFLDRNRESYVHSGFCYRDYQCGSGFHCDDGYCRINRKNRTLLCPNGCPHASDTCLLGKCVHSR